VAEALFIPSGDGHFEATEHARGPWDPGALHGGAPAALITQALERIKPGKQLSIARLSYEFLAPVPFSPIALSTSVVRDGRRVQELAAELRAGDKLICRASALRIQAVPEALPRGGPTPAESLPGPEHGRVLQFALNNRAEPSFATTGMEMSWLEDPGRLGPGRLWMRLRQPLLPGEPATPLARLVAAADFTNGVSSELPFAEYLFINADLSIHLWRQPQGEWIGLDARTLLPSGGMGVAESVLHDSSGPVGRCFQTLVVQPR